MKLYHGTSGLHLDAILAEGLKPRGAGKKGNWAHTVRSNHRNIYLTDAYAPYFVMASTKGAEPGLVIEIETDRLFPLSLVPDEDVLEQAGRGRDSIQGDMRKRTMWYRNHLDRWRDGESWRKSLEAMGTCGHTGVIQPGSFTRIAVIPQDEVLKLIWHFDASICLMNYRIFKDSYRVKSRRLFGEREPFTGHPFDDPRIQYEGIKILTLEDGAVISEEIISIPDERDPDRFGAMANGEVT